MEGIVSSSSCLGLAVEFELGWKKTSAVDQATAGQNELRSVTFFFSLLEIRAVRSASSSLQTHTYSIQSASGSPHGWVDERRLFLTLLVTRALDQSH